ncbi:hypothetical protein LA6_005716 (plasmid) [Paracoccaceae bacterium]|nr:hypothetical protein LA6_005716 [Paracoccaceae bacterium]
MRPSLWRTAGLLAAVLPAPAWAHGTVPGFEGFYTGVLHPFSTPAQVMALPVLGILIGAFDLIRVRRALAAFAVFTLLGVLSGGLLGPVDSALFAVAAVGGALAALAPGQMIPVALVAAACGGAFIGAESIPDPGRMRDRVIMIAGALLSANIVLFYLATGVNAALERFPRPWVRIGFRIGAAWLTAISMVMLALRYAPQPG